MRIVDTYHICTVRASIHVHMYTPYTTHSFAVLQDKRDKGRDAMRKILSSPAYRDVMCNGVSTLNPRLRLGDLRSAWCGRGMWVGHVEGGTCGRGMWREGHSTG